MSSFPRFRQWLRHHLTSVIATCVDFLCMVASVELLNVSPVAATAIGAAVGGVSNFILGRYWIYRQASGAPVEMQLARYVVVSLVSLALNTWGEHLFANVLNVQYVVSRVITAVIVSNAWNYPMQRFFVFRDRRGPQGPQNQQVRP